MRATLLFTLTVILFFAQAPAHAEQPAKIPQIGYLNTPVRESASLPPNSPRRHPSEGLLQGLQELGYVEGQNVNVIFRMGEVSQFPDLAADLVRRKVDVIVSQHTDATQAAMRATKTIPIVMTYVGDPVLLGLVASLARPGGNVTGISGLNIELGGKWLELAKETVPTAKRMAVLWNLHAEIQFPIWKSVEMAARSLNVELEWLEVGPRTRKSLYENIRLPPWRQMDFFIALPGIVTRNMQEVADFGLRNRIPNVFWRTDLDLDQMGGLMAYGANRHEQSRRAAYFVDKILKGAKPGELPVELPKSFELVINGKVAKELGITIPHRVLAWADHVFK